MAGTKVKPGPAPLVALSAHRFSLLAQAQGTGFRPLKSKGIAIRVESFTDVKS
jgi:hypothetical protein